MFSILGTTSRLSRTRKTVFRPLPDLLRGIKPLCLLTEIDFPNGHFIVSCLCFVVDLYFYLVKTMAITPKYRIQRSQKFLLDNISWEFLRRDESTYDICSSLPVRAKHQFCIWLFGRDVPVCKKSTERLPIKLVNVGFCSTL